MISRRDVMGAGLLGTLTGTPPTAEALQSQTDLDTLKVLRDIDNQIQRMNSAVEFGQRGPGLASGLLADVRNRFTTHFRSTGKFPDFMEIGSDVFYDVYDWHVRHGQQIQITRISEQRFSIQWMFTQLIVRFEQDPRYLGIPFDRG